MSSKIKNLTFWIYAALAILFTIMSILPFYFVRRVPSGNSLPLIYPGFFVLIYGGWIGVGLIFKSNNDLYKSRTNKSVKLGLVGACFILVDLTITFSSIYIAYPRAYIISNGVVEVTLWADLDIVK